MGVNFEHLRYNLKSLFFLFFTFKQYMDDVSSQLECLSHNEQVMQEKLKILNEEINELCEANKQFSKQHMEKHRQRLSEILMKSVSPFWFVITK